MHELDILESNSYRNLIICLISENRTEDVTKKFDGAGNREICLSECKYSNKRCENTFGNKENSAELLYNSYPPREH